MVQFTEGESVSKRTLTIQVLSVEPYDDGWPPTPAYEFLDWLHARLGSIPEQFRGTATVEIESHSGYEGDHSPSIEISYKRQETDEEMAERLATDEAEARRRTEQELRLLAKLQAKYSKG